MGTWSHEGPVPQTVTLNGHYNEQFSKYLGTYRLADTAAATSEQVDGDTRGTSAAGNTSTKSADGVAAAERAGGAPLYVKQSRCLLWPFQECGGEEQCQVCRRQTMVFLYRDSYGVWAVTDNEADLSENKGMVCSSEAADLPSDDGLTWKYWGKTRSSSGDSELEVGWMLVDGGERRWVDAPSVACGEGDDAAMAWETIEARIRSELEVERAYVPLRVNLFGHCKEPSISALMGTVSWISP
jgi:hypothetical protein